ncbi:hypothetical protein RchiOBHm_Chr5g0078721 [Rosa chinensis]|uniref:Uncharacterized protein n=1 Tax=Rosa chinensis TaxID=74649 RepID=A0A2P6QMA3_ROSCH|nr:hypothetical protein RchiOBHm_Chr5g0078721 [Rosa chinensis]
MTKPKLKSPSLSLSLSLSRARALSLSASILDGSISFTTKRMTRAFGNPLIRHKLIEAIQFKR